MSETLSRRSYPLYAVGDYSSSGGQQYYGAGGSGGNAGSGSANTGSGNYSASSGSSHSSSGTGGGGGGGGGAGSNGSSGGGGSGNSGGGNGSANQQYIVPVDEATLLGTAATNGAHQRDSPQAMTVSEMTIVVWRAGMEVYFAVGHKSHS